MEIVNSLTHDSFEGYFNDILYEYDKYNNNN